MISEIAHPGVEARGAHSRSPGGWARTSGCAMIPPCRPTDDGSRRPLYRGSRQSPTPLVGEGHGARLSRVRDDGREPSAHNGINRADRRRGLPRLGRLAPRLPDVAAADLARPTPTGPGGRQRLDRRWPRPGAGSVSGGRAHRQRREPRLRPGGEPGLARGGRKEPPGPEPGHRGPTRRAEGAARLPDLTPGCRSGGAPPRRHGRDIAVLLPTPLHRRRLPAAPDAARAPVPGPPRTAPAPDGGLGSRRGAGGRLGPGRRDDASRRRPWRHRARRALLPVLRGRGPVPAAPALGMEGRLPPRGGDGASSPARVSQGALEPPQARALQVVGALQPQACPGSGQAVRR
jgi:hypothetical protein